MENKETLKGLGDLAKRMAEFQKENFVFSMRGGPKEELPLEISEIDFKVGFPLGGKALIANAEIGDMVAVRPVSGKGEGETFLGILIGYADLNPAATYHKETKKMTFSMSGGNPAMYVFKLKRVVYGIESWWKKIETEEQLESITDKDIHSTWYVQVLKAMENTNESNGSTPKGEDVQGEAVPDPVGKTST